MPCTPKKTLRTIVQGGHHYLAQVKGNQPKLFEAIRRVAQQPLQTALDVYTWREVSHGREQHWKVRVFKAPPVVQSWGWANLTRFIHVQRRTCRAGHWSEQSALYISDVHWASAREFYQGIRQHWHIENRLHWVKDVIFGEDKNRIRSGHAPVNCSVFASIAINLLRRAGYDSIKHGQIIFAANVKELWKLLRT